MKKNQNVRLNIIVSKNAPLSEPLGSMSPMGDETIGRPSRLFEINQGASGLGVLGSNQKSQERALQSTFEEASPEEQKLYRIWQVEVSPQADVDQLIKVYQANPNVESVEIDQLNELYLQPTNDPLHPQLYGHHKIQCEDAWPISKGRDVIVAVLDTGVDYNHPDIKGNMWSDVNGNFGWDFSDNDNDPVDYHGHGTHVAGTIAATANNNIGIVGVAPEVQIMAIKIFPNAYDSKVAQALRYAVDMGAKVLNNSWGPINRRPSSPTIEAAIDYVHSKGGICVFAAGNSNDETIHYSPANYSKTISVGASDQNDQRANFSNYGKSTDIAAPGVDILSLMISTSSYIRKRGTSMACPHVAAACALLLSKNGNLSFNQVKTKLQKSADLINTDKPIGNRLNAKNLVK